MKHLIFKSFSVAIFISMIAIPLNAQNAIEEREKTSSAYEASILLKRSQEKLQHRNYNGAIADINQSILLDPDVADSYYYRGLIRAELEDQLGAISDFDDAILRNPRHSWAYYHRAGVFFNLGNQSEGILDLQLAAQLFSEQGDIMAYQKTKALLNHFGVTLPAR